MSKYWIVPVSFFVIMSASIWRFYLLVFNQSFYYTKGVRWEYLLFIETSESTTRWGTIKIIFSSQGVLCSVRFPLFAPYFACFIGIIILCSYAPYDLFSCLWVYGWRNIMYVETRRQNISKSFITCLERSERRILNNASQSFGRTSAETVGFLVEEWILFF